MTTESSIN